MSGDEQLVQVHVEVIGSKSLRIRTFTEDGKKWVEQEAPKYGKLYQPGSFKPWYDFHVHAQYDDVWIKSHLENFNQSSTKGE
jgi:hypothetical protein